MPDDFAKGGKYSAIYRRVFDFHQRHAGAKTDEDWEAVCEEYGAAIEYTEFERALFVAVYAELMRANEE